MKVEKNLEAIFPRNTTEQMILDSLNMIQAAIQTGEIISLAFHTYFKPLDQIVSPEEQDNCVEILYQFMMITPEDDAVFSTQGYINFCKTYNLDYYLKYKNKE